MRRSDPEDALLRWQTFLLDGFEEWPALAAVAAAQYQQASASDVLKWMIHDFYFRAGAEQSVEDIIAAVEHIAIAANAIVKDQSGKVLGYARDVGIGGAT